MEQLLHRIILNVIPKKEIDLRNKNRSWQYGYDEKYDIVIISKNGTLGEIYEIEGLKIGLPLAPIKFTTKKNKFVREPLPKELEGIANTTEFYNKSKAFIKAFKPYISREFKRRNEGYWFMNNNEPTYITGSHYMHIQWGLVDGIPPYYRYADRIWWLHLAGCIADDRSYGQLYGKIRRSGFSNRVGSELINTATSNRNAFNTIVSKSEDDASFFFVKKVVPINKNLPFFFLPIQSGSDSPKSEILYDEPAKRFTINSNKIKEEKEAEKQLEEERTKIVEKPLMSSITFGPTLINTFDGQKILLACIDEAGKWKDIDVLHHWDIHKECLSTGSIIRGKAIVGSTVERKKHGGAKFEELWEQSDITKRSNLGQTTSGLYRLFIPCEYALEGHIDEFGNPILYTPEEPVMGEDGKMVKIGAINFWESKCENLKNIPSQLNDYKRKYPRTIEDMFRAESTESLFNITNIYDQLDFNNASGVYRELTRGNFEWKDNKVGDQVLFIRNPNGRFLINWFPPEEYRNKSVIKGGMVAPMNAGRGVIGIDPYGYDTAIGGGSNGAMLGFIFDGDWHDGFPNNQFIFEYCSRPKTIEIFIEDAIKVAIFYSLPIFPEINKGRLATDFKNRGYRRYVLNRPDKKFEELTPTERSLGGIFTSSGTAIDFPTHALETYIDRYIGLDRFGDLRGIDECGIMPFEQTLVDWSKYNGENRQHRDLSIAASLCLLAAQKPIFTKQIENNNNTTLITRKYRNKVY